MAIEILDHGACKAAGTYAVVNNVASLNAQGIASARLGPATIIVNLTLEEAIAYDELIAFVVNSSSQVGVSTIQWIDENTLQVSAIPEEGEDISVDFLAYKIQGMKPIEYAPYVAPTFPVIEWGEIQPDADRQWIQVAYSEPLGRFVRVGWRFSDLEGRISYSPDGEVWTDVVDAGVQAHAWECICWAPVNALFVALSRHADGHKCATSPDGINWTLHDAADADWFSVCELPSGTLFASGSKQSGGADNLARSVDAGVTWTPVATPVVDTYWTGAATDGTRAIVGDDGTIGRSTDDAASYSAETLSGLPGAYINAAIVWVPQLALFAVMGGSNADSCDLWTSPDGIDWTLRNLPSQEFMYSLAWIDCTVPFLLSMLGNIDSGTFTAFASYNGTQWIGDNPPIGESWNNIAYAPNQKRLCAVGGQTGNGVTIVADVT